MLKKLLVFLLVFNVLTTILSFDLVKTEYGSEKNNNHPNIVSSSQNDYDTGLFYETYTLKGEESNPELFVEEENSGNLINKTYVGPTKKKTYIGPTNPFEGDTFVPNKSYLTSYYSHLVDNIPMNRLGICGYTGITMFLSFYDSYWNDNFIIDKYDSNVTNISSTLLNSSSTSAYQSPGVRNDITWDSNTIGSLKKQIKDSGITDEKSDAFKEALDRKIMAEVYSQIDNGTFLGKLFDIAIKNGSIKPRFVEGEYYVANEGYLGGIGVNNIIMNSVLSDYINDNYNLNGKVKLITSKLNNDTITEKRRIRNEIIEIVKTGRPVLMGGNGYKDKNGNGIRDTYPKMSNGDDDPRNEGSFGHVVVAYDYDENTDTLYGNMGWNSSNQSHINLDQYFNIQFSDYWALNISLKKKDRTNNYIFTDKNSYYSPGLNYLYNTINPVDYKFSQSYNNEKITNNVTLKNTNETFITNRLRCGYIEGECINISTRRVSPGLSYLEYTFDKNIQQIEVDLSWWSKNERVNEFNSNYRIEYLTSDGIYFEIVDLWDLSLSWDRTKPTKVTVTFPSNVKTFRFYGLSSNPINDRNKGRLSIFDMTVIYR